MTEKEYGDFDLTFEWKVAPGKNRGLKYEFRRFGRQWLVCRGTRIERWLNGEQILETDTASAEWQERVRASKLAGVEGFGGRPPPSSYRTAGRLSCQHELARCHPLPRCHPRCGMPSGSGR